VAHDLQIDVVLAATVGLTGAQLANVANEAALLAARRRLPAVTTAELVDATERVVAGAPRRSAKARAKELRTVAVHECGHALLGAVTSAVTEGDIVSKVSV
jgi:cell division protease FtsH